MGPPYPPNRIEISCGLPNGKWLPPFEGGLISYVAFALAKKKISCQNLKTFSATVKIANLATTFKASNFSISHAPETFHIFSNALFLCPVYNGRLKSCAICMQYDV